MSADYQWVFQQWLNAIPPDKSRSVVEWAKHNVKLIGSARSESYDPDITPWTKEPLECAADGTRRCTFVKPVQCGGSACGEIALLYWLSVWNGGDLCYYWQSDTSAEARWAKHFEKKLRACNAAMGRTNPDRFKFSKCQVIFNHCNLVMQGVTSDRSVASDSFRGIICEEVHDESGGWSPGRLDQCFGRQTAFWNSVAYVISNAGRKNDQLHKCWLAGTRQFWEVRCPACGGYHRMRMRWDDAHPELGGLRYDSKGTLLSNGTHDWNALEKTIFYQMGCCGHKVTDNAVERRALSLSGRYSAPTNPGASLKDRSYTLQAVSVDYIPWIDLIKQKSQARLAKKLGDPEPWLTYLRERECEFIGLEDAYVRTTKTIVLSEKKKNRDGLPNRKARYAAIDRQKGVKADGELPHWWMAIRDFDANSNSLLVWEGKLLTDGEVLDVLRQHVVEPCFVVVDTGYDADYVYTFCLKHGFNCLKVDGKSTFAWEDGSRHIWSEPQLLREYLGQELIEEYEPQFFHVAKWGMQERLEFIRARTEHKFEIPADVSEDYKEHLAAWIKVERRHPRTNEIVIESKQVKDRDDLYQCEGYITVLAEMDGLIGIGALPPITEVEEKKEPVPA